MILKSNLVTFTYTREGTLARTGDDGDLLVHVIFIYALRVVILKARRFYAFFLFRQGGGWDATSKKSAHYVFHAE